MAFEKTVREMEQMLEQDWFEWLENDEAKYEEWRDQLEVLAETATSEFTKSADPDAIDTLLGINEELPILYGEDVVLLYTTLLKSRKEDDSVYERYLTILGAFTDENHPALYEIEKALEAKDYTKAQKLAFALPKALGLE